MQVLLSLMYDEFEKTRIKSFTHNNSDLLRENGTNTVLSGWVLGSQDDGTRMEQ